MAGTAIAGGLPLIAYGADAALAADAAAQNPVVRENTLTDQSTWSTGYIVGDISGVVTGYARRTSVNLGEPIELVISGPNRYLAPPGQEFETVDVELYRLGYYGGKGARLVWQTPAPVSTWQKFTASGEPSNNGVEPPVFPEDTATGLSGRAKNHTTVTVPGTAAPASGVYLAKLKGRWLDFPPNAPAIEKSGESHIIFIVRDDNRPRDILAMLPSNTWQAYNYWSGRSLYTYNSRYENSGSVLRATGSERAAKVSLDRPYNNWIGDLNWVLRTEFPAIYWLEQQGYDVAYTEDLAFHYGPGQAMPGKSAAFMILGHGEYWSKEMRDGTEAARDAGTHIYNLGANTAYWRVRYETVDKQPATDAASARVLVCYKTIEGGGAPSPTISGTADPVAPTTTWRDPGKGPGISPPGTTAATPSTYAGNNRPERSLFGVQYIGDDDAANRPLTVPLADVAGELTEHRAWRHTRVAGSRGAKLGKGIVGWEWDGLPAPGQPFNGPDPVVKPGTKLLELARTDPRANQPGGAVPVYLQDGGRGYGNRGANAQPPAGWQAYASATTYTAPSGALVFSAGTIQWSWGLGPHHLDVNGQTYAMPPVDESVTEIQQATANLLVDGGIYPTTPTSNLVIELPDTTAPQVTLTVINPYQAADDWYAVSTADPILNFRVTVDPTETSPPVRFEVTLLSGRTRLATTTFKLNPGQTRNGAATLKPAALALLPTQTSLPASVQVTAVDGVGNITTISRAVNLRAVQ